MSRSKLFISFVAVFLIPFAVSAQNTFSVEDYARFLDANENVSTETLIERHAPKSAYYREITPDFDVADYAYLDSIILKYNLTDDELSLLADNGFVVTERVNNTSFADMLHEMYGHDLPVFVSTDAVLYALHMSYDEMLEQIESYLLKSNLENILQSLHEAIPQLAELYEDSDGCALPLDDVDTYVTVALSLILDSEQQPYRADMTHINALLEAAGNEQPVNMPLFSTKSRYLDFSQFTPRGHYVASRASMANLTYYFKAMMWLGRMDFMVTSAAFDPMPGEDLRRMAVGALMMNELIELAGIQNLIEVNDSIITFLVGESDNLTPAELDDIAVGIGIVSADDLLDDEIYNTFIAAVNASTFSEQKIVSSMIIADPFSSEPDPLPVSYRVMGQRFVVDSYILSNVVYDRIIRNGTKIFRPLPDPLDVMFVLGNDDALPLLHDELDCYYYAPNLADLRCLVDSYDDTFWRKSLYNVWIQLIRDINPRDDQTGLPNFMTTAAWRQQKLNTQCASWAQLRHDTLLYAKQSYTPCGYCSYPHSYIEPNPVFFRTLEAYAQSGRAFFSTFSADADAGSTLNRFVTYYDSLSVLSGKLAVLAEKELNGKLFDEEEISFLQKMLFAVTGQSAAPPFTGWYADMFYSIRVLNDYDYLIADVHTQPTDKYGNPVGRVLHVGTGLVNLGVFLAESPSNDYRPMAYVGPVMSFYTTVTDNFKRLTDQEWQETAESSGLPPRPDWVNIYLADANGSKLPAGRELPSQKPTMTGIDSDEDNRPSSFLTARVSPNPFNPSATIHFDLAESARTSIVIYDVLGRQVAVLMDAYQSSGGHNVTWSPENAASGVYFCRISAGGHERTVKMTLLR